MEAKADLAAKMSRVPGLASYSGAVIASVILMQITCPATHLHVCQMHCKMHCMLQRTGGCSCAAAEHECRYKGCLEMWKAVERGLNSRDMESLVGPFDCVQ